MTRRSILAIALAVTAASAVAQTADDPTTGTAPADAAKLVVFRAYAQPTAWSPTLKVDGVKVVAIPNRGYTVTRIAAGDHKITLAWPILAGGGGGNMELTVEAGKTYYVEVTGFVNVMPSAGYIQMASGIALVEPEFGVAKIRTCCTFKAPKEQ
jgi:hypothetical protein